MRYIVRKKTKVKNIKDNLIDVKTLYHFNLMIQKALNNLQSVNVELIFYEAINMTYQQKYNELIEIYRN